MTVVETDKITRFEVISNERGRIYVAYCPIELSIQDEGQTLKVFVKERDVDV